MTRQHWVPIAGIIFTLTMFVGAPAESGDSDAPLLQGERHVKGTVEQIKGEQL
ncbi:hypothetical protein [Nitrospira sp. Nam80]